MSSNIMGLELSRSYSVKIFLGKSLASKLYIIHVHCIILWTFID